MSTKWHRVALSHALRQVKDVVHLEDEKQYRQVTVSLHGRGLRLRQLVKGADVKTKRQYLVRSGQFIYSRIDARNGAFGLVPPELDGAVVSNDFPVFDIEKTVANPKFIGYLAQSRSFISECQDPSRGVTNRQRLAEERLLSLEVALPPLDEQHRIVETIDALTSRLAEAQRLRESVGEEREEMLHALARELAKDAPRRPLQQVAPVTRRPVKIYKATMYPELGIRSFGRGTFHKPAISGANIGQKRLFHIHPGDLVFSNVFSWEGAIAVAKDDDEGRVGSHRFITCVPEPTLATAEFLRSWFLTDEGMSFILEASPGSAGRNRTLGLKKLKAIPVPVPPLEAQQRLTQLSRRFADARRTQDTVTEELKSMLPALLDLALNGDLPVE